MKFLILLPVLALLTACGDTADHDGVFRYQGSYTFAQKYCGDVGNQYVCRDVLTPTACSTATLFSGVIMTGRYGNGSIIMDGNTHSTMTFSGNDVMVASPAQNLTVFLTDSEEYLVIKYATGCELAYTRNN